MLLGSLQLVPPVQMWKRSSDAGPLIKVFAAVRQNTYHPQATFQPYPDLMPLIIYLFPHFCIYQVHHSQQSSGQRRKLAEVALRLQKQACDWEVAG